MGIFSKSNSKEYNDRLEKILEGKPFEIETKNLLLSMLYKIETAYEDYHIVKVASEEKELFINELLRIIENECEEIRVVTPKTEESRQLEEEGRRSIIDATLGKILVYANEKDLLYAIFELDMEFNQYLNNKQHNLENLTKDEKIKFEAVQFVLATGRAMSMSEVIRDFNGWSWSAEKKKLDNINVNLIYQNMIMLLGTEVENKFFVKREIEKNSSIYEENTVNLREINNNQEHNDIEINDILRNEVNEYINVIERAFKKVYISDKVNGIINSLNIIILSIYAKQNEEARNQIKKILEYCEKRLDVMQDNNTFLEAIEKEKKDINKEIKKIDKLLNDGVLLKKEYEKINSKLADEDKIFSVSHLAKMLENDREELIEELRRNNNLLGEQEFILEKERLERQKKFYNYVLEATLDNNKSFELLKKIQIEFLKCFKVKIQQAEGKEEILKLIYEFRYYCVLPINELQEVKDIDELQEEVKEIINLLVDKSIDNKVIENISNSVSLCYNLLEPMFKSRIIELNNIYIKVTKNDEKLVDSGEANEKRAKEKVYNITVSYYDSKAVAEEEYNLEVNNLLLLNIKLNKKVQLFI